MQLTAFFAGTGFFWIDGLHSFIEAATFGALIVVLAVGDGGFKQMQILGCNVAAGWLVRDIQLAACLFPFPPVIAAQIARLAISVG